MPTTTPIEPADLVDLQAGAIHAAARLGLAADSPLAAVLPPAAILAAIDQYLVKHFAPSLSTAARDDDFDIEELAFEMGCLWGEQLVGALGWSWVRVQFNDQAPEAIGVGSKDLSLIIYPFQTIFLYHEQVLPVRIARSFEILSEPGRVPMLPPGGLENVMDHIQ